jgi:hypothetical protein
MRVLISPEAWNPNTMKVGAKAEARAAAQADSDAHCCEWQRRQSKKGHS